MAALCIGVGALSGPLAYLLGREVLDERRARMAALLLALAPGALLFGATSADAVYLTLGLLAAWPLAARSWRARAAGAVALAVGVVLRVVAARGRRVGGDRDAAARGLARGAGAVGDVRRRAGRVLRAALRGDRLRPDRHAARDRGGLPRRHRLDAAVLVLAVRLAGRRSWSSSACRSRGYALRALAAGETLAMAIFAVIAFAAVRGFTKAETERIWLFLAPFVCLAAATERVPLRPLLGALAVQAVLYELAFDTVW